MERWYEIREDVNKMHMECLGGAIDAYAQGYAVAGGT